MATQKQYLNSFRGFLIILGLFLANFTPIANATENNFIKVDKNTNLEIYEWTHRPIVIFANSDKDPNFISQIEFLSEDTTALLERDIIVLIDTDPKFSSSLRKKLRPHGFAFVLIGKDGQVKLRKPSPWNIREIARVVDKMPIRQQEIARKKQEKNN
tara:strand:- start:149 stop:619 length:471 start_codon:yes stop_codon:yes gene_type:complete